MSVVLAEIRSLHLAALLGKEYIQVGRRQNSGREYSLYKIKCVPNEVTPIISSGSTSVEVTSSRIFKN